jgi:hypothetical protein
MTKSPGKDRTRRQMCKKCVRAANAAILAKAYLDGRPIARQIQPLVVSTEDPRFSDTPPRPNETRASVEQRGRDWVEVNQQKADQVQHVTLPLGMVVGWIERALNAEHSLGKKEHANRQVTARIFPKLEAEQ